MLKKNTCSTASSVILSVFVHIYRKTTFDWKVSLLPPAYEVWGRYCFHRRVILFTGEGASRIHPHNAPLTVDAPPSPTSGCTPLPPPVDAHPQKTYGQQAGVHFKFRPDLKRTAIWSVFQFIYFTFYGIYCLYILMKGIFSVTDQKALTYRQSKWEKHSFVLSTSKAVLLSPANEVWGKVMFLHMSVTLFTVWGLYSSMHLGQGCVDRGVEGVDMDLDRVCGWECGQGKVLTGRCRWGVLPHPTLPAHSPVATKAGSTHPARIHNCSESVVTANH